MTSVSGPFPLEGVAEDLDSDVATAASGSAQELITFEWRGVA